MLILIQLNNQELLILKNIKDISTKLKKIDLLYNQIFVLAIFIKYLYNINKNEKITKNIKIGYKIELELVLSFLSSYIG